MFNRFAICQAYMQLESDYNVDGILRERPSNQRRNESIGVQLQRIGYSSPYQWVDITAESDYCDDPDDEADHHGEVDSDSGPDRTEARAGAARLRPAAAARFATPTPAIACTTEDCTT